LWAGFVRDVCDLEEAASDCRSQINEPQETEDVMRVISLICMIAMTTLLVNPTRAEMAEGDAWNVGSVFAAGSQCEMKGYITQGQVTPLMALYIQSLSAIDGQRLSDGYQEGLRRTATYSKNLGRWNSIRITAEYCSQVQYGITQYKLLFDSTH
jgi:hypothetical protein